jgi:hypothetical protein
VTRRTIWGVVGCLTFLNLYFAGVFPPVSNANELAHFQTVVAYCEHGTFAIDEPIETLGDHWDKAVWRGHAYSDKAPGLSLAAIPVYRALRIFLAAPTSGTADTIFRALRFLTVSLVSALALARFGARAAALADPRMAPLITFAAGFGTPFLFYSRSFFSHAWTASLLFLSWDLLLLGEERPSTARAIRFSAFLGAGFLAGWAVASEYPALLVALPLAVRVASGRRLRRVVLFGLGACAAAAILLWYNLVCFGSPLTLSYTREASPALKGPGFAGMGTPSLTVSAAFLFSPSRGVLLQSPFWLWAIPGFWKWFRSGRRRADCVFCLLSTILFFAAMTGFRYWHGGSALGSRYLLPVLFLTGLSIGPALDRPVSRGLFAAAVVFAAANHFVATLSWPHFPPELAWPIATGSWWFLIHGWIAPNLLLRAGASRLVSLLPPVLAVVLTLSACLAAAALTRAWRWMALLLGLGLHLGSVSLAPSPPYRVRLWRAEFYGLYSGRDPERRELLHVVRSARGPLEEDQAREVWAHAGKSVKAPAPFP